MKMLQKSICALLLLAIAGCGGASKAPDVRVAVAANFLAPARDLADAFSAATGHDVDLSAGSTGKLYAQIQAGAPFDVFLAADWVHPAACVEAGHCVEGGTAPYAIGRLALLNAEVGVKPRLVDLAAGEGRLAIANPRIAPYGQAALETLETLGLQDALEDQVVEGDSVAQCAHLIASGAVEMGFVALSQALAHDPEQYWVVPADHHQPLLQEAALTMHGRDIEAAQAFWAFLQTDAAHAIIARHGYALP